MFWVWSENVVHILKPVPKILLSLFVLLLLIVAKSKHHRFHVPGVYIPLHKFVLSGFYFFFMEIFVSLCIHFEHFFIVFSTLRDDKGSIGVFLKIIVLFVFDGVVFEQMNVVLGSLFENVKVMVFFYFFNLNQTCLFVSKNHLHFPVRIHDNCFREVYF